MKKYLLIISVISIGLVIYFIVNSTNEDNPKELPTELSKADESQSHSLNTKKAITTARDKPELSNEIHQHGHSSVEGKDNQDFPIDKSWWFHTPNLVSSSRFSPSHTSIVMDPSCTSMKQLNAQTTLEQNFERIIQSSPQQRYQEDLFYFSLTQFWKLEDDYYQFVALWDRDMPANYRYEFYRSKDKAFNGTVEAIDLPIAIPANKNVISTNQYVAALEDYYLQRGAQIGSRITESSINDPKGDHQITLVNSQVTKWNNHNFNCDSKVGHEEAYCFCHQGDNS